MWSLIFLSSSASTEIATRLPDGEHVAAFMPDPNPTTGFFFDAPCRDIIDLDLTVEAAMTLIMSAGMVQPGGSDPQKLAALAELHARRALLSRRVQLPSNKDLFLRPACSLGGAC